MITLTPLELDTLTAIVEADVVLYKFPYTKRGEQRSICAVSKAAELRRLNLQVVDGLRHNQLIIIVEKDTIGHAILIPTDEGSLIVYGQRTT